MSDRKYTQQMIVWDVPPRVEDERFIPIYSAQPQVTYSLAIVTDELVLVSTHYVHKRTIPCIGKANDCEGCKGDRQTRVKGYLGCFEPNFDRLVIAELTNEAMTNCNVPMTVGSKGFRERALKLWRIGKGRNGAVRCEVYDPKEEVELPEEFDVRATLVRIWNGQMRPK